MTLPPSGSSGTGTKTIFTPVSIITYNTLLTNPKLISPYLAADRYLHECCLCVKWRVRSGIHGRWWWIYYRRWLCLLIRRIRSHIHRHGPFFQWRFRF
jgi:hypothetical protein